MVITNFNGVGVGFGFGVGCGFGVGWGFGEIRHSSLRKAQVEPGTVLDTVFSSGMPLNILGLGAGGGCGVGLGLGWGFGSAFGSQYRSSRVTFQGLEFSSKGQNDEKELRNR